MSSCEEGIKKLFAITDEIRADIKKILMRLPAKATVDAQSPIKLTELGKEISSSVNAKEWSHKHAPKLEIPLKSQEYEIYD